MNVILAFSWPGVHPHTGRAQSDEVQVHGRCFVRLAGEMPLPAPSNNFHGKSGKGKGGRADSEIVRRDQPFDLEYHKGLKWRDPWSVFTCGAGRAN